MTHAAAQPEQLAQAEKPAEQAFKNIQVLKGLPASQLMSTMFFMRASLNADCGYCHIYGQFDKDEKPAKQTARKMIQMVRQLNESQFQGRQVISCHTCHRGQAVPAAPLPFAAIAEAAHQDSASPSTRQLPAAEQLFARHLQAVGGQAALKKIQSRVMKGTRFSSEGWNSPIEIHQRAPASYISSFNLQATFLYAYDGSAGWSQDDHAVHDVASKELAELKQDAEFYRDLNLNAMFSNPRTLGIEKTNGRDAYVVDAKSKEGAPKQLYFDVETGLLVRMAGYDASAFGPVPFAVDYADYREVDGIQVPSTVSHLRADFSTMDKFTEIKHNVSIPLSKFQKPSHTPPPPNGGA